MTQSSEAAPKVELYYATDPLCSFCWAFEPTLTKFRYQYRNHLSNDTILMGGMIPSWDTFGGDQGNNIQKAVDVTKHWQEIGEYTRMPIDGTIWTEKPVDSSLPSSRVFEIVRRDHPEKANQVLRQIREAIMLRNLDISQESVLKEVLDEAGLNSEFILKEAAGEAGEQLLMEDLQTVQTLQTTGFPTVVLVNNQNQGLRVVGAQPFEALVEALTQMLPEETTIAPEEVPPLAEVVKDHPTMLSKEIEVLYDIDKAAVPEFVSSQVAAEKYQTETILKETYYKFTV